MRQDLHGTEISRATCCRIWQFKRLGRRGDVPKMLFSLKRVTALLLFFLFSIFYVWLSVGGGEWEEGEGRPLEKDSRFENTAENLGACRLTFSSILSWKGQTEKDVPGRGKWESGERENKQRGWSTLLLLPQWAQGFLSPFTPLWSYIALSVHIQIWREPTAYDPLYEWCSCSFSTLRTLGPYLPCSYHS